MPTIQSRQKDLEPSSLSGAGLNVSDNSYYQIPKEENYSGNLTQKVVHLNYNQERKISQERPNEYRTASKIPKFMNPSQLNIVEKFLEGSNIGQNMYNTQTGIKSTQNSSKSPGMKLGSIQRNISQNDSAQLMKKLKQLESQLKSLDEEYDTLKEENEELLDQNARHRDIIKKLTMYEGDMDAQGVHSLIENTSQELDNNSGRIVEFLNIFSILELIRNEKDSPSQQEDIVNEISVGEIHSMYQDLFLTDMKREVEDAQTELKQ